MAINGLDGLNGAFSKQGFQCWLMEFLLVFSEFEEIETGGYFVSFFVFVLVMVVLSCLLERARERGYLSSFRVRERGEKGWCCPISFLQMTLWSFVRIPKSI